MRKFKFKSLIGSALILLSLVVLLWGFIEGGYLFPQFYGKGGNYGQEEISTRSYQEYFTQKTEWFFNAFKEKSSLAPQLGDAPASLPLDYGEKLMVGGTSLGIIMKTEGVLVVGYSAIEEANGQVVYPAKEAGITLGDGVLAIEGETITSDEAMLEIINLYGAKGELEMELQHGGKILKKKVKSYYCPETGRYRVGLYVRDNMGGVGTLTFYNPKTKRFGALGHPLEGVANAESNGLLGRALPSAVRSIKKATQGETGEKIGYFENGDFDGEVDTVGNYGIYGVMNGAMENPLNHYVYPAKNDEVAKGEAKIVTVVEGSTPEFFDIEIVKVDPHDEEGKGLTIEITDKDLLSRTGGIIQGMSGSPIIQNNKLVGAVTYVTVNEPQKGYGCLITFMLEECK